MDAVQPAAVPPVRDAAADRLTTAQEQAAGRRELPRRRCFQGEGAIGGDDLAWRVERACIAAYPPRRVTRIGDWALADSGGGSRRTNAASALTPVAMLTDDTLAAMRSHYTAAALPTIVRVTDLVPDVSGRLDTAGFDAPEGRSRTLLRSAGTSAPIASGTLLTEAPDPAWLAARRRLAPGVEGPAAVAARLTVPACYAQRHDAGDVAAIGYAATADGIAVIEAVATDPIARRRGHARAIVTALSGWAIDSGARHVALQVEATNHAARALYDALGFATDLYGYHYRRSPPCPPLA